MSPMHSTELARRYWERLIAQRKCCRHPAGLLLVLSAERQGPNLLERYLCGACGLEFLALSEVRG